MEIVKDGTNVSISNNANSPFIRSRYSERLSVSLAMTSPTKTRQEFKEECDVNLIVKRHAETGLWQNNLKVPTRCPQFIDISNAPDAQTAHNLFIQARESFMALPSDVRKRFNNNPHELIAFVSDDSNYDEALKYGLVNERPPVLPPTPPLVENKPVE